jgi:NADPH-dependent curcumin reductase CurA
MNQGGMKMIINRQIRLKSRPQGLPDESHFESVEIALPLLGEQEVTVKTSYISVDPYMRGRMNG